MTGSIALRRVADDPRFDFLTELTARGIEVARLGKPIRCPLPDHDDRTPSFSVFQGRHDGGYGWRCHGCGHAGDPVTLLAILDNLTVSEWCRHWASVHTGPVPARQHRPSQHSQRGEDQRHTGYTAAELASYLARCHQALLTGPGSAAARRYARARGLTGAEVRRYQLGIGIPATHRAFRSCTGRLILPCPGGLDARTIHPTGQPRYRVPAGDPHTPWGLNHVDSAAGPLVIVEGILDAIALARADIPAIALRGTGNLSPHHAHQLATASITHAYIALDATPDVTDAKHTAAITWLEDAGIQALLTVGPPAGTDFGDLLTVDPAAALTVINHALRLRPGRLAEAPRRWA